MSFLDSGKKALVLSFCFWAQACFHSAARADLSDGPNIATSAMTIGIAFIVSGLAISATMLFGGITLFKKLMGKKPSAQVGQADQKNQPDQANQAPSSEGETKENNP